MKILEKLSLTVGTLVLSFITVNAQLPAEIDTANGAWYLSWNDEFDYENSQLDDDWISQNGPSGHIECSRWRENSVVENGVLRLLLKKESRGGQDWTCGNIWTKEWFKYGYFECRYKYAAADASNNSFWLMTQGADPTEGERFEIDINEGHYPAEVNMNIHNHGPEHSSLMKSVWFGIEPDINIPLETPVSTNKIRFSTYHGEHFHIREFRIYNNNGTYPEVFSESADTDVDGLINYAREATTTLTVSGKLRDGFEASRMIDGRVNSTSWVSQAEGDKWIEFEFDEEKTVGCIQFIHGWPNVQGYNALLYNYKIEYWDGTAWQELKSFDLSEGTTFADEYHTYGCLWNEKEVIYYFDGVELDRRVNKFCYSASPIWLSLAIFDWMGTIRDEDDGKFMEVDYVRYYKNDIINELRLDTSSIELALNDTYLLTATPYPLGSSYTQVSWSSSDINVATVDSLGEVKAVGLGSAIITATNDASELTDSCTVRVKEATAINSTSSASALLYPNPVNESLNLVNVDEFKTLKIYNSQNQLLLLKSIAGENIIDVSSLSKGIYLYILEGEGVHQSGKLVKL